LRWKSTPSGSLTTLYSFCSQSGCPDGEGEHPEAELVQATNGDFYGTTAFGGAHRRGTVFKITPSGTLTTLYSFCSQGVYPDCTDGDNLIAGLVQASNGDFYGTTAYGGPTGDGTVFSLSVGLGPFVETRPTSGVVGKFVEILGTNLTGATSVSFNGTAATFTVNLSGSAISTTVLIIGMARSSAEQAHAELVAGDHLRAQRRLGDVDGRQARHEGGHGSDHCPALLVALGRDGARGQGVRQEGEAQLPIATAKLANKLLLRGFDALDGAG
jgi:uncharacterized repeat protein (TIGR03803 family)